MKIIPALAAIALILAGCGNDSTGGDPAGPGGAQPGGDSPPMAAAPPDLATLPGGRDPVQPLADHPPLPDACKILTPAMVLALIPGAGKDGVVTTPNSSTDQDGTPVVCQYVARPKSGGTDAGNIIIDFKLAGEPDQYDTNETLYKRYLGEAKAEPLFMDYAATLGTGSRAFYNPAPHQLYVLYRHQPFTVSATGNDATKDLDKWRDNVDVAVVRNIVARMNH